MYSPIRFETIDSRAVDKTVVITAQVVLDQDGHLVPDAPYFKFRSENLATDGKFRSQIAAAAASPR